MHGWSGGGAQANGHYCPLSSSVYLGRLVLSSVLPRRQQNSIVQFCPACSCYDLTPLFIGQFSKINIHFEADYICNNKKIPSIPSENLVISKWSIQNGQSRFFFSQKRNSRFLRNCGRRPQRAKKENDVYIKSPDSSKSRPGFVFKIKR